MDIGEATPGQRLASDTEPELGLGILLKVEFGRVEVFFPAANEHRQYAAQTAPLRRVRFKEGDKIKLHSGEQLTVDSAEERKGLLIYHANGTEIPEALLSDALSFSTPEDRLLIGQVDEGEVFQLRADALFARAALLQSPVRGFAGGRVDLIPHQMFIANEVTSRLAPRVLLADEVGLGKTIEAGLILHRLHLTGRADRILILLPESMIHQWFIELWRRFNLLFSIFDAERCQAIELNHPGTNPFLDSQLVIADLAFLAQHPDRAQQAAQAQWNLLVVDEAHHLEWTPECASPQYTTVERLAAQIPGLLLLTATPQQLGPEGHFARLRLLDPDRYHELSAFEKEAADYELVAQSVNRLLEGKALTAAEKKHFSAKSERIKKHCTALAKGDENARSALVSELLDAFGTGRVMFRNTRAALSGFPQRHALLEKLKPGKLNDPDLVKIKWLASLLKEQPEEKFLLICKSRALAESLHEQLQREINVNCALFHEGLSLMQRDRNAAFFSDPEGARVLICSEIGSEGRNFQFAHHLVLFDLPANPELLEQRIGRLDRIGQTGDIHIHVPYLPGTESEVLARWYHEGLNAFEENPHGAGEIAKATAGELNALCANFSAPALKALVSRTKTLRAQVGKRLARGYDRLLELGSCRAEQAEATLALLRKADADRGFEELFIRILDHFGVSIEDLGGGTRTYLIRPSVLLKEAFPALPEEGLSATFQRTHALQREDLHFMSPDHPMALGALDLLLGGDSGNSAFALWKNTKKESLLLEVYAVVECVAPASLHLDRFLPATPLRIVIDHEMNDRTAELPASAMRLEKGDIMPLLDKGVVKRKLLPSMLEKAKTIATEQSAAVTAGAANLMNAQLQSEIERLQDLRLINSHVRPEEIEALEQQKAALAEAIAGARVRVDALRLIHQMS